MACVVEGSRGSVFLAKAGPHLLLPGWGGGGGLGWPSIVYPFFLLFKLNDVIKNRYP